MNTVSFSDLNKSGAISDWFAGQMSSFTPILVAATLAGALVTGLIISWVYKKTYRGVLFSPSFSLTLIMLTVVTAPVVMAIGSDVALSMGMVGALSIVRFRNAVKNPLDLLYLFWSISAGIMCGVGLVALALLLCVIMTILVVLLQKVPNAKASSVVVLRTSKETDWDAVRGLLNQYGKNVKQKSRCVQAGQTEVIFELFTKEEDKLIAELEKLETVDQISFLSHDGEYRI